MKDMMIDIETLDDRKDSVVLSIGAVFFDIEKGVLGPMFDATLNIDSQLKKGRTVSARTIAWWMGQAPETKTIFKSEQDPQMVLGVFREAFYPSLDTKPNVWGNGASFDISILESLYSTYEIKHPWAYNKIMDLRTFKRFVAGGAKIENDGSKHRALDDAVAQANYVLHYTKGFIS